MTCGAQDLAPLTYDEIREFVRTGVAENDFLFHAPALIQRSTPEATETFVFLGAPMSSFEFSGLSNSDVFQIQFRLELVRRYLFKDVQEQEFISAVCDRCEAMLSEQISVLQAPSDPLRTVKALEIKRRMWTQLYSDMSAFFHRRGDKFSGLLEEPLAEPWTLRTAPLRLPFTTVTHYISPTRTKLIGPRGVVVKTISRFRSRILSAKNTPYDSWPWDDTFDLNPDNPPLAWFTPGAVYFVRIERGDAVTTRVKRFETRVKEYEVPLP